MLTFEASPCQGTGQILEKLQVGLPPNPTVHTVERQSEYSSFRDFLSSKSSTKSRRLMHSQATQGVASLWW